MKWLKKDESGITGILQAIIGVMIVIVVGVLFLGLVQDQVDYLTVASADNNNSTALTGVSATLMEQVPLFYVLGLVFMAVGFVIYAVKEF
jgi:membrane-anchored glycerophosphoryl diester phosphodiesterase (GDPDase)